VPDTAPAPPLLKVNRFVVFAVTVVEPPKLTKLPFIVRLEFAK